MIEEINLIDRLEGELDFEYKLRLCSLKLNKEIDLDWSEIVEILGLSISGDHLRKLSYGYKECEQYLQDTRYIEKETLAEHIARESKSDTAIENVVYLTDEEDRVQVIDMGDKFHIYTRKRSIVIDKEKVKKIKEMYCDKTPLTVNELCRKLDIARRDFMLLKQGLSICHSDVPYLDEDIQEDKLGDLVVETLERRKEKYFLKLQQEEIKQMETELSKYRKQDYLFEKIVDKLETLKPLEFNMIPFNYNSNQKQGILPISDVHFGKKACIKGLNGEILNEYNEKVFQQRMEELFVKVLAKCKKENLSLLHVVLNGDMIDGILRTSQLLNLEYGIVDSTMRFAEYIANWLNELGSKIHIKLYSTLGNHSQIRPLGSKNGDFPEENMEKMIWWYLQARLNNQNIEMVNCNRLVMFNVLGINVLCSHGEEKNLEQALKDYKMMYGENIHMFIAGHLHSSYSASISINSDEIMDTEVLRIKSICGVDDFSEKIRKSASPGTSLFIIEEGEGKTNTYDIKLS